MPGQPVALRNAAPAAQSAPASEPEEDSKQSGKVIMSVGATVVVMAGLAATMFLGLLSTGVAFLIFAVFLIGLLVFHGGGTALTTGLSDTDGDLQREEEEEQRKVEEAEYFGEHHPSEHES